MHSRQTLLSTELSSEQFKIIVSFFLLFFLILVYLVGDMSVYRPLGVGNLVAIVNLLSEEG